ncbi:GPI mannosyltransferase 4-like [Pristis pectinata]|uniref:GPI mannosyltransferase 4-like n=1 Tax=Pristis pectinata TaxID=685728 RepID=UPI00223DD6F7|nr:GPI mannosyltransferase 4-like [Pristis pectinata]
MLIKLASEVGFDGIDWDDVQELLEELTNMDLSEPEQQRSQEEGATGIMPPPPKQLTAKRLLEPKIMWLSFGLFRILWCLAPQTGYIHPDEFFQSPEVMAGDILNLKIFHPWEFNTCYPSRSILFLLVTTGFSFTILKNLQNSGLFGNILNSYTLLVFPRFYLTCLSFILDYSVYHLACLWDADPWNALTLLSMSHVMLVFHTRTFSNSIEAALFALLLLLVALETKQANVASDAGKKNRRKNKYLIGVVLVSGFFNRPTFIVYALVPMFLWLSHDQKGTFRFSFRTILSNTFGTFSSVIVTTFTFILIDTFYFDIMFSDMHCILKTGNTVHKHIANLRQHIALTPLNFIVYNLKSENLSTHGSHPWFTHLTVNGLILFGTLHLSAVVSGIQVIISKFTCSAGSPKRQQFEQRLLKAFPITLSITEYLILLYFVPMIILSFFCHQEGRFLSPLIVPVVLHCALKHKVLGWKTVIVVFNILCSVLFGCLHQGGLIPCIFYLEKLLHLKDSVVNQEEYILIFYHTYMPPRHLLNVKSDQEFVRIIDLGGSDVSVFNSTVNRLLDNFSSIENNQTNIYIIAPSTVEYTFNYCNFQWKPIASFFPHLSMEDPPNISKVISKDILSQLSLNIFKVQTKGKNSKT